MAQQISRIVLITGLLETNTDRYNHISLRLKYAYTYKYSEFANNVPWKP